MFSVTFLHLSNCWFSEVNTDVFGWHVSIWLSTLLHPAPIQSNHLDDVYTRDTGQSLFLHYSLSK